ncbi:YjeF N-terminal domain-containing protein [Limtongia smithiae]|uniref:YjeF N-terminal domain-containing protein n=1 Tax=Limtongia smithiae TaxID=1125753 RepID=UPI0034CE0531
MAESYIGLNVSVTLQNGAVFSGIVSEINGTKLRLINVTDASTNAYVPSRVIDGSKIADLHILASAPDFPFLAASKQKQKEIPAPQPTAAFAKLQDPAIVALKSTDSSFAKSTQGIADASDSGESDDVFTQPQAISKRSGSTRRGRRDVQSSPVQQATKPLRRKKQSARIAKGDYSDDGWASGDTAGFKNTEFDFQGNLDRFDKKTVFDEIRQADTTDPSERLVSFNLRDKTADVAAQERIRKLVQRPPRRDYLPSENVLGTQNAQWQGLSDSDDGISEQVTYSGQMDDEESEAIKPPPPKQPHRRSVALSRVSSRNGTPPLFQFSRPPRRLAYCTSDGSASQFICPSFGTGQISAVEQAALTLYSLQPAQLAENAGAAISRLALSILGGRRRFERRRTQINAHPVVVVLAGNHDSGARAIAGARMLVNRLVRVVVLFTDESTELARPKETVDMQMRAFKSAGGKTTSRLDVLQATLRVLDSPPELIIDALQGLAVGATGSAGARIGGGVPGWMYEAVQWASQQSAPTLAIDIPAGTDADTGTVLVSNMGRAKWLLCLGMPTTGVAHYLQYMEEELEQEVESAVADIGIPIRCFRKTLGEAEGLAFASEWKVVIRLE